MLVPRSPQLTCPEFRSPLSGPCIKVLQPSLTPPSAAAAPAKPQKTVYANPLDEIFSYPRALLRDRFPRAQSFLKKASYPAIMTGAVTATAAGIALGAPHLVTFVYVSALTVAASTAAEYLIPYEKKYMPGEAELKADFTHTVLTTGVFPEAYKTLAFGAFLYAGTGIATALGTDSAWNASGLTEAPLLAQAALVVGIGSFFDYWKHRILHKSKLLWPIHEVHHTSERLTTLHAGRSHVLDIIGTYTPFLALGLFGLPQEALVLASTFIGTHVLLQHSNADLDLGILAWIMPGPRNHRWHHSSIRKESNTNFGNFLTIWDHVFGTFYLPDDRVGPQQMGLGKSFVDPEKMAITNWLDHQRMPFQKRNPS